MIKAIPMVSLVLAAGVLVAAVAERRGDADQLIAARQAAFKLAGPVARLLAVAN